MAPRNGACCVVGTAFCSYTGCLSNHLSHSGGLDASVQVSPGPLATGCGDHSAPRCAGMTDSPPAWLRRPRSCTSVHDRGGSCLGPAPSPLQPARPAPAGLAQPRLPRWFPLTLFTTQGWLHRAGCSPADGPWEPRPSVSKEASSLSWWVGRVRPKEQLGSTQGVQNKGTGELNSSCSQTR